MKYFIKEKKYTDNFGEERIVKEPNISRIIGVSVFSLIALIIILGSFFTIDAGERGVVLRFGEVKDVRAEGLHFKLPLIESVKKFTIRTDKIEREASSASKDLQIVTTQIALNYSLEPSAVSAIYSTYKDKKTLESKSIDPAIQDIVKSATAQFNAEALITRRAEVKDVMEQDLRQRLQSQGIIVSAMNIVDFRFSEEFDKAIEAKVTAEQNALKAENDLKKVEFEAQQRIEQAKAEAEAIRIQAQAVTQQGGKDYVQLQAIEKWNGILPAQFVPGSAIPFINLNQ